MSNAELNELIMAHLEGSASEEQQARLETLLAEDQENIERYIQYVRESAALSSALASNNNLESIAHATQAEISKLERPGTVDGPNEPKGELLRASDGRAPVWPTYKWLWWGTATAAAILIAAFASQGLKNGQNNVDIAQNPSEQSHAGDTLAGRSAMGTVAKIIRKVDCIWEDEKWNVDSTAALTRGQTLRISQGVMEIEFDCGAQVTLEGPARFTIAGPMNGLLHAGGLSAVVPKRARGFSIKAPTTNVVDLGTSFSLRVREDGNAEIHVIDGEVLSQPLNAGGTPARAETKLLERDSLLVSFEKDEPISFDESSSLLNESNASIGKSVSWDKSIAQELVLWLAADGDVERDSSGGVRRWGDQLYGGNTASESAWQLEEKARPLWVAEAIGGKPALRFNGDTSYLVTDSLATSDEQTLFFVAHPKPWRRGVHPKGWAFVSRQILNYNGPPNIALQFGPNNKFSVWNFVPSENRMLKHAGEFRPEPLTSHEPHIFCYTYSSERKYAELWIDGQSQGKVQVTDPAAIDSPKYIGCHWGVYQHFEGDLAELLIFNEALSGEATNKVAHYLAEKYGILIDQSNEH